MLYEKEGGREIGKKGGREGKRKENGKKKEEEKETGREGKTKGGRSRDVENVCYSPKFQPPTCALTLRKPSQNSTTELRHLGAGNVWVTSKSSA